MPPCKSQIRIGQNISGFGIDGIGGIKMEEPTLFRGDLSALVRRGVVTTDPANAAECCGMPRDEDGFCVYRPGHPIFVVASDSARPYGEWED
jgi:hypothetical protein